MFSIDESVFKNWKKLFNLVMELLLFHIESHIIRGIELFITIIKK